MSRLIDTLAARGAPPHILAALEVLQCQNASLDRLAVLTDPERSRFLEWCDVRQITLLLSHLRGSKLPAWVSDQILQKAARYELRFEHLKRDLFEIVGALNAAGLEFVMLKGLSHAPALSPDARLRAQGDIDLWLTGSSVYAARDVLTSLGYVPLVNSKSRHLAPMGRPRDWKWRGDLYDPDMPISVELHYELWSEQAEYIAIPELERFWERKRPRDFDGHRINVLCDEDLLGFATLHLLLHLLHGELPLQRAWEIGRFLDKHANDDAFWKSWRSSHSAAVRKMEICIFYLVAKWFECRSLKEHEANLRELPPRAKLSVERSSLALLTREWEPNKLELWLHLALIENRKQKARIAVRRLIPIALPSFVNRTAVRTSFAAKLRKAFRQRQLITARLRRHLVTFFPTLFDGLRWFLVRKG